MGNWSVINLADPTLIELVKGKYLFRFYSVYIFVLGSVKFGLNLCKLAT
jgi:hypothetical protein